MNGLRVAGKLWLAFAHLLSGFWTIKTRFPAMSPRAREDAVQAWAARMLQLLGIALLMQGQARAAGPLLLVANHVSWLDILVMHAAGYCRFVSKAGIKEWPVVGFMAAGAGTLFIERESRRDAHRVVHHMVAHLQAGEVLAVFPEGTTGDGVALKPFHANLIQAAISAQVPVQPLALRFVDSQSGQTSFAPRYVDDDTLLVSVWRTLKAQGLQARVALGAASLANGRDRRAWASDLRAEVQALLDQPEQQRDSL